MYSYKKELSVVVSQDRQADQSDYYVLTANRLLDGRVVWFTPQEHWGIMLEDAQLFSNKENAEKKLQEIIQSNTAHFLIDLHYVELINPFHPASARENIRAFGPSTHPEFNPRSIIR
nr:MULTISPECIES: DUF2849 domain-containing protein [Commensalibacter]